MDDLSEEIVKSKRRYEEQKTYRSLNQLDSVKSKMAAKTKQYLNDLVA